MRSDNDQDLENSRKRWLAELIRGIKGDRDNRATAFLLGITASALGTMLAGGTDPERLEARRWNRLIELTGRSYEDLWSDLRRYVGIEQPTPEPTYDLTALWRTLPLEEKQREMGALMQAFSEFTQEQSKKQPAIQTSPHTSVGDHLLRAIDRLGEGECLRLTGFSPIELNELIRVRKMPSEAQIEAIVQLLNHQTEEGWTSAIVRAFYKHDCGGCDCGNNAANDVGQPHG